MISNNENSSFNRLFQWLLLAAVVAVGVANLYMLLQERGVDDSFSLSNPAAEYDAARAPIFVNIGPLTVNLQSDSYGQRLLYIGLTLQVPDVATRELLTQHMPEVQSRLLLLLSGQSADLLIPATGKQKLAQDIVAQFQTPLAQTQSPLKIDAVLFTNFIVQ
jgi:flagellar FliL protein